MPKIVVRGQSLSAAISGGGLPVGGMIDYAGAVAPSGWLLCDGSAVSRTTYAQLFTAIATAWGPGDGSTTFNLPDFRRRVAVGSGGVGTGTLGNAVGNVGGAETHALITAELATHTHTVSDPGHSHVQTTPSLLGQQANVAPTDGNAFITISGSTGGTTQTLTGSTTNNSTTGITANNAGSGTAHNNLQPSAVTTKIIKI